MMGVVSELAISDTDKGEFLRKYFEKDWKTTEYNYRNEDNSLAFTVVRADAPIGKQKEIRPFGQDQSYGYPNANKKASRPLYNLPELLHKKSGQRVFVVEGEKCADACADAYPGDIFLTWASGNKAIDYTDWKPLETDTVYLVCDTDESGRKGDWEPMTFDTWCPKVLSGIRGLRDTTLDRSTIINLARKRHTDKLPRWRNRDRSAILELHSRVVRWTGDCHDKIVRARE